MEESKEAIREIQLEDLLALDGLARLWPFRRESVAYA
jgi:hypothetical protein